MLHERLLPAAEVRPQDGRYSFGPARPLSDEERQDIHDRLDAGEQVGRSEAVVRCTTCHCAFYVNHPTEVEAQELKTFLNNRYANHRHPIWESVEFSLEDIRPPQEIQPFEKLKPGPKPKSLNGHQEGAA